MGFLLSLLIIACAVGSYYYYVKKKEEKEREEYQARAAEHGYAMRNPIRLIYDNTKLKPWCVEKYDGQRYVQVTGWFAKEENARAVYDRLKRETSVEFPYNDYQNRLSYFTPSNDTKWTCPDCKTINSSSDEICQYCGYDKTINHHPEKKSERENSAWDSYINR